MNTLICQHCKKQFESDSLIRYKVFREKFTSIYYWFVNRKIDLLKKKNEKKSRQARFAWEGQISLIREVIRVIEERYCKHIDFHTANDLDNEDDSVYENEINIIYHI